MGGTLRNSGVPMDPASARRLASGVWKYESQYSIEHLQNIEAWILDKAKLNAEVERLMREDPWFYRNYRAEPERVLDGQFGEGTFKAMMTRTKYDDYYREKRMAMPTYINTGATGTSTITTTTSSSNTLWIRNDSMGSFIAHDKPREQQITQPYKPKAKRLVRPFKPVPGKSLLAQLQYDFEQMCREQLRLVNG